MAKTIIEYELDNRLERLIKSLYDEGDLEASDYNNVLTMSIFPKWLTETEAEHQILSFNTFKTVDEYQRFLKEEDKIISFFLKVFNEYKIVKFDYKVEKFYLVRSVGELIRIISLGIRELQSFIIYVEGIEAVFWSGYDLDITVYLLNNGSVKLVQPVVDNSSLFLLSNE